MTRLDDYRPPRKPDEQIDYSNYNKELAEEIDKRIENDKWLSNHKQPYYVVETVERTLAKSHPCPVHERRTRVQAELFDEVSVEDKQTIQAACHVDLITKADNPSTNHRGEIQWHEVFDRVIRSIEQEWRSEINQ